MLDRIGIHLSVTNRLFALLLAVEGDEFDLVGLTGPFERRSSAERRRVVDRKNSGKVRMSLEGVLSRAVAFVFLSVARQLGGDLNFAARAAKVVLFNYFFEPLHAQQARLGVLVVENHDLAACFAKHFDHGFRGLAAAA